MKKLFLLLCLFTTAAQARQELMPGLWKITFKIKTAGRIIEPAKNIKESLAKLSQQQQEDFKRILKEEAGIDEEGKLSICYSPESFELEESAVNPMGDHCISKVTKRSSNKIISNFICENGIRGINTWFIKTPRNYIGVTKVIAPWGEKSEIIYQGSYFSPLCDVLESVEI